MTEVCRRQIDILGRLDYIRGMSPWILCDFRAGKRTNRSQRGWNRIGRIVIAEELDVLRPSERETMIVPEREGGIEVRQMSGIDALPSPMPARRCRALRQMQ